MDMRRRRAATGADQAYARGDPLQCELRESRGIGDPRSAAARRSLGFLELRINADETVPSPLDFGERGLHRIDRRMHDIQGVRGVVEQLREQARETYAREVVGDECASVAGEP